MRNDDGESVNTGEKTGKCILYNLYPTLIGALLAAQGSGEQKTC